MSILFEKKELFITLRILRRNPLSIVGSIIVAAFVVMALAAVLAGDKITPYNPYQIVLPRRLQPPSWTHPFGTDQLGRDVFSRVIIGAPIDLAIALIVVAASIAIGVSAGSIGGYCGGRADEALMRITDVFLAFPMVMLALAVSMALGPGIFQVIEALIVVWWPVYARTARAETIAVRENQYIEAARASGLSNLAIIRNHVVPNIISPLLVYGTLDLGFVILYASVLSYLGLGAQPPQPEWGKMVFDGQIFLRSAWWIPIIPGLIILIVVIGFSLFGDALRDALDPRMRK